MKKMIKRFILKLRHLKRLYDVNKEMSKREPIIGVTKKQLKALIKIFDHNSVTFEGVKAEAVTATWSTHSRVIFMEHDTYYKCYPNGHNPTSKKNLK